MIIDADGTRHSQSWWEVDLQSVGSIGSIDVWGRTDCCSEMSRNYYLLVSDVPFSSTDLNTARNQAGVSSYYVATYNGTNPTTLNINRSGRYIRVQLAGSQYLVLGEVKVWQASGSPSISTDGIGSLSYDSATNRITTSGFTYDAAGNQISAAAPYGGTHKFLYDAANRLVQVRTGYDLLITTYTYGPTNERLVTDEFGLKTYYASSGGTPLMEYIESGGATTPAWSKSYIYLGARLLSTITPNGAGEAIQYHHPDRLGTRLVTNAQDTTYFEQQTLPFGTALNESTAGSPAGATTGSTIRRFTTYDRSVTTGLDYAANRHYDAQQGRFTQVDPIGMSSTTLSNPQTLNLFAYCANDPINHTDPSGLGFFSFLKKIFKRVVNALVAAAVSFVYTFITSGGNLALSFGVATGTFMASLLAGPNGYKPGIGTAPTFPVGVGRPALHQIFQGTILSRLFPSPSNLLKWTHINGLAGQNKGDWFQDDCGYLANFVDQAAKETWTNRAFVDKLYNRFVKYANDTSPADYNEFHARGFRGRFADPHGSPNQVRHFAGIFINAFNGGSLASTTPGYPFNFVAAVAYARRRADAREPSIGGDTRLNEYAVKLGVRLAFGQVGKQQLGAFIRRYLCGTGW